MKNKSNRPASKNAKPEDVSPKAENTAPDDVSGGALNGRPAEADGAGNPGSGRDAETDVTTTTPGVETQDTGPAFPADDAGRSAADPDTGRDGDTDANPGDDDAAPASDSGLTGLFEYTQAEIDEVLSQPGVLVDPNAVELDEAVMLLPMPSVEEDREFIESMRGGQAMPAVLVDGRMIDGRRRRRAAIILQKSLRVVCWPAGGSKWWLVKALNLDRRHMSIGQRAMYGARCKEGIAREAAERMRRGTAADPAANVPQGDARDVAGRLVGVSGRSIDSASAVLASKNEDLIALVDGGRLKVSKAGQIARLGPEPQAQAVAEVKEKAADKAAQNKGGPRKRSNTKKGARKTPVRADRNAGASAKPGAEAAPPALEAGDTFTLVRDGDVDAQAENLVNAFGPDWTREFGKSCTTAASAAPVRTSVKR